MGNHTATRARGRSSGGGTGRSSGSSGSSGKPKAKGEPKARAAKVNKVEEAQRRVDEAEARHAEAQAHLQHAEEAMRANREARQGHLSARATNNSHNQAIAISIERDAARERANRAADDLFSAKGRLQAAQDQEMRNAKARAARAAAKAEREATKGARSTQSGTRAAKSEEAAAKATTGAKSAREANLEAQLAAVRAENAALRAGSARAGGKAAKTGEAGAKASGRGKGGKTAEETLRPITTVKDEPGLARRFDPYHAPDARYLRVLYGDHQLAQALEPYQHDLLRETARRLGMPTGRSKAATISNIVSHITHEPYQETVAKLRRATERMNRDIGPGGTYDAQKDYYAE